MNKLDDKVQAKLFAHCDVETLVVLRKSCKAFYSTINSLDDTLIKQKVLERAPWFSLNEADTGLDTWHKCALLLSKRSAQCKRHDKRWKLFNDLHVAMVSKPSVVSVNATDITNYDKEGKDLLNAASPIFEEAAYLLPSGNGVVDGVKIKTTGIELDLKTLEAATSTYKPASTTSYGPGSSRRSKAVCSPSGLILKSQDGSQRITCIAENDNLLHIRMQMEFEDDTDKQWEESDMEFLIHKPTCLRDKSGNLMIREHRAVEILPQGDNGKTFIKLLPGSAGALMTKFVDTSYAYTYLAYVEPTKELRHVIICLLPRVRLSLDYEYFDTQLDNHVFYNGYLYIYFEGRFLQLWVDLGVHRLLEWDARHMLYGHSRLPQKFDTQSLTACRVKFPSMGTIMTIKPVHERHAIVRGKKEHGMDRYVTIDKRCGQAVVDLLTGKMHLCEYDHDKDLTIPLISNNKIIFASISEMVFGRVEKRLIQLQKKGESGNIAKSYTQWASIYIPVQGQKLQKAPRQISDSGLYDRAKTLGHMFNKGGEYGSYEDVAKKVVNLGPRPICNCGGYHSDEDEYYDEYSDEDTDEWDDEDDEDDEVEGGYFVKERDVPIDKERDRQRMRQAFTDSPDEQGMYDDDTPDEKLMFREAFAAMVTKPKEQDSSMMMFAVGLNDGYTKKKPLPRKHGKMFDSYMDGYTYGVEKMTEEVVAQVVKETMKPGGMERLMRGEIR